MPNAIDYGRQTYTASNRRLNRYSELSKMMLPLAWRDFVFEKDDFTDDTLNTFWTAVANGGGAGAADPVITVAEDGMIAFATGTAGDATASSSLISAANFYGDRNCGVRFGFITPAAVTECRIEMGFTDVVPGSSKSVVNSLTTPTVNTAVADAAVYVFNHAGSTTTHELVTIGTAISAAKTTYSPPTAWGTAEYHEVQIQLLTNKVVCYVDDVNIGEHNAGADSIEGGSALAVWFRTSASNGTSKTTKLDYVARWKDRKRA